MKKKLLISILSIVLLIAVLFGAGYLICPRWYDESCRIAYDTPEGWWLTIEIGYNNSKGHYTRGRLYTHDQEPHLLTIDNKSYQIDDSLYRKILRNIFISRAGGSEVIMELNDEHNPVVLTMETLIDPNSRHYTLNWFSKKNIMEIFEDVQNGKYG